MFGIPAIYWVLINSVVSFFVLLIISKLLGKKQIAQLEFVDYTIGISLGSIASEMATDSSKPFYYYLIAMAIFAALAFLVAILGRKAVFFKHILKGRPSTLIYEGKIEYGQLKRCKIDVNDLLSKLREKGFFDIQDVAYAIFEPSGEVSVLPKGTQKPVVISDITTNIKPASLSNVLIVDGIISNSGLNEINKTKKWLFLRLNIQNKADLKNIILATYNQEKDLFNVNYKKE